MRVRQMPRTQPRFLSETDGVETLKHAAIIDKEKNSLGQEAKPHPGKTGWKVKQNEVRVYR